MHLQINLQIAIYEKSLKLLNEPTLQMIDDSNSAPFWRKKKRKKDIKMLHIEVFKTSFKNIYNRWCNFTTNRTQYSPTFCVLSKL